MNVGFVAGSLRRVLVSALLAASAGMAEQSLPAKPVENPGAWKHYEHTFLRSTLGGVIGVGFGMLATVNGNEDKFAEAAAFGLVSGYVVGSAWGANTVSDWHEEHGSFGLDLLSALGAGFGTVLVGAGMAEQTGDDTFTGWGVLATCGTVPLGAVVAQRLVAGDPPSIAAWHPAGASPEAFGLVARWSFR